VEKQYCGQHNSSKGKPNEGIALATVLDGEGQKKSEKKKEIMCFR